MPAPDKYHDTVKRALIKAGWIITDEQVLLYLGDRRLWIDVEATRNRDEMVVLIEVKGFESSPSQIKMLIEAIGQYSLYREALTLSGINAPLYLAIPIAAHNGIFKEIAGITAIRISQMKLLVYDPALEEIVRWIPQP